MRGRRMVVRGVAVLGMVSLLLGACASCAFAQDGASAASGSSAHPVAEFKLRATHGFSITVSASKGQVHLTALKGPQSVFYSVPGTTSPRLVKAKFPGLGSISVGFHPSGRMRREAVPKGCKGRTGFSQRGKFVGRIEFKGEQGYTAVHASVAKGAMTLPGKVSCPEEGGGAGLEFTTISATARSEGIALGAIKASDKSGRFPDINLFTAFIIEAHGGMSIMRSIEALSRTESFAVTGAGNEITSATITPPKPFAGSATYEKQPGSSATWSGSLTGDFLGRGEVSLAGPQFSVKISH